METINVFGKTYSVSKQAKYSYYASIIIILTIIIKAYKSKKPKPLNLIVLVIAACLSPYATNCVSQGKCEEYGWYLSLSNMIMAAMLVMSLMSKQSKI